MTVALHTDTNPRVIDRAMAADGASPTITDIGEPASLVHEMGRHPATRPFTERVRDAAVPRLRIVAVVLALPWGPVWPRSAWAQLQELFVESDENWLSAVQLLDSEVLLFDRHGLAVAFGGGERRSIDAQERARLGLELANREGFVRSEDWSRIGRVRHDADEAGRRPRSRLTLVGQPRENAIEVNGRASFHLSNDGNTVVALVQDIHVPETARVALYRADGQRIREIDAPHLRMVHLSADGGRVLILTSERLLVLDRDTGELRELPVAQDMRLSRDGRVVAAIHGDEVRVYVDGQELGVAPTQGMALDLAFSADGRTLGLVDRWGLSTYRAVQGSLQRVLAVPQDGGAAYRSVELSADGELILAGALRIQRPPNQAGPGDAVAYVRVFGSDGTLRSEHRFPTSFWTRYTPDVRLYAGDRQALVLDRFRVFALSLPAN